MWTVKHKEKGSAYQYPDEDTAREHAAQAVEQSGGKLKQADSGEHEITLSAAKSAAKGE
jgi:hypothetical protein